MWSRLARPLLAEPRTVIVEASVIVAPSLGASIEMEMVDSAADEAGATNGVKSISTPAAPSTLATASRGERPSAGAYRFFIHVPLMTSRCAADPLGWHVVSVTDRSPVASST